jgi:hypothetical protein
VNALRLAAPGIVVAGAVEVVVLFGIGVPPPTVVDADGDPGAVDVDGEAAVVAVVPVVTDVVDVVEGVDVGDVVELGELDVGNAVGEAFDVVDDVTELIGAVSGTGCACAWRKVGLNTRATATAMTDAIVGNPRRADGMANRITQSAQKQNRELLRFQARTATKLRSRGSSDPARNSDLPLQTTGECLVQPRHLVPRL